MEDIYRRYSKMIYGFLFSKCADADTAEELTQETFYQAMKSIDRFRGESSLDPFEKLNDKMRSYACVLLALIDNCGEIKWSYTDNKGDTICESLDLDTANEFLEIKAFGRSALDVQKLSTTAVIFLCPISITNPITIITMYSISKYVIKLQPFFF